MAIPEPWRGDITASVELIDHLERQIDQTNKRLKSDHSCHPYIPLLMSAPGIGWVLAFTIAGELGEIERFSSPEKLAGYTGLCPRVNQSGERDRRGALTKAGPKYLRWAMLEATMHALRHPAYAERYQHTKRRLGRQRGAKVAQVDIARLLFKYAALPASLARSVSLANSRRNLRREALSRLQKCLEPFEVLPQTGAEYRNQQRTEGTSGSFRLELDPVGEHRSAPALVRLHSPRAPDVAARSAIGEPGRRRRSPRR